MSDKLFADVINDFEALHEQGWSYLAPYGGGSGGLVSSHPEYEQWLIFDPAQGWAIDADGGNTDLVYYPTPEQAIQVIKALNEGR